MSRRRHRQHTREFKLLALARMDAAPDVQALARELDVEHALLYRWQRHYVRGGAAALRNTGRPRPVLIRPSEKAEPAEAGQAPAVAANPALAPASEEQPGSTVAPPISLAAHGGRGASDSGAWEAHPQPNPPMSRSRTRCSTFTRARWVC